MRNTIHPAMAPKAAPPRASTAKISATCPAESPPPVRTSSAITTKTTTPMPSLKSDSPVIFVSSSGGTPAVRRMAPTAIGSVGEMSAPKSRAHGSDSVTPTSPKSHQAPNPTTRVEMHHAGGGEGRDDPPLREEAVQVDMQRPREQQGPEHPVEQGGIEVHEFDEARERRGVDRLGAAQADQQQRAEDRDHHQADGGREPEHPVIDPGEEGREGGQGREGMEDAHAGGLTGPGW